MFSDSEAYQTFSTSPANRSTDILPANGHVVMTDDQKVPVISSKSANDKVMNSHTSQVVANGDKSFWGAR